MADEAVKLNSMRFLEAQNVPYETHTYDENVHDGVGAAQAMGFPPGQVFKTLVVQLKGDHALVMIPADRELDLKRFARAIGEKKVSMTSKRGAEAATGLKTGGIGALALMHKRWGVYLDESAKAYDAILVNAGQRGVNVKVGVDDLVRVLNAKMVDVTEGGAGEAESPQDESQQEITG